MGLVINRLGHPPSGGVPEEKMASADPRIFILSVSPDLSASYIPVMNSIFSAQKLVCAIEFLQSRASILSATFRKSPSTFAKFSARKRCFFNRLPT
jgi:hypothetical protein